MNGINTISQFEEYFDRLEREAEEKDPGGLLRRRDQLHSESRTIHQTIMLHFDGIDALNKRQNEVEAQIAAIDDEMEVR